MGLGSDIFRKVAAGDKLNISASFYNSIVDMLTWWKQNQVNLRSKPLGSGVSQNDFVLVRNDSGATVNRFHILGIDDVVITPTANLAEFKNNLIFSGITPTTAAHYGKFVIMNERLVDGKIGRAYVMGAVIVQIDITDAAHLYADVKDSDRTMLQSKVNGCAGILWRETGTGTKWAAVRLGGFANTGTC